MVSTSVLGVHTNCCFRATRPIGVRIDNTNSTISYSSGWTVQTNPWIPSANQTAAYHETSTKGANASLTFDGVAIALNGVASWGHGLYTIVSVRRNPVLLNEGCDDIIFGS